ncbi:MAG: DUF2339 domain-containing protein [Rhodocyclaceae bacterium]
MDALILLGLVLAAFYFLVLPFVAFTALSRARQAADEVARLQRTLAELQAGSAAPAPAAREVDAATGVAPVSPAPAPPAPTTVEEAPAVAPPATETTAPQALVTTADTAIAPPQPAPPAEPGPLSGLIGWFFRGNPLAKIGALLLFFGIGYLFKYSVEHALVSIEIRLAGAGLLSLGLLFTGWRLRTRQHLYGLILQGAAIGALYLTVFASARLYPLLPFAAAFVLLVVVCAASVALAVLQNAQSLAVVAALGGYLAPVLLSTGGGSHIALFGYYALLSTGILAVSVWQLWRPLNLVGFIFTFAVAGVWGEDAYTPALYLSCQLFLVFNLVVFGVLAPLAMLRHASRGRGLVDGTLVFGTPLLAFGYQYVMMDGQQWALGAAFSALALGALYLALAHRLLRRKPAPGRALALSYIALGGGFVTLAIPLALAARWTALAWSLEGLGVTWAGLGQRHRRMALSGSLLLVLAALSALGAWPLDTLTLILVFGVLALSTLTAGWLWSRQDEWREAPGLALILGAGGIASWLWCALAGSHRLIDTPGMAPLVGMAIMALSALAWTWAGERCGWRALRHAGWLLWGVVAAVLAASMAEREPPLAPTAPMAALACWLLTLACAVRILRLAEADLPRQAWRIAAHTGVCWIAIALLVYQAGWYASHMPWGWQEWAAALRQLAFAVPILLMAGLERLPWPLHRQRLAYWGFGLAPLLPLAILGLWFANQLDGQLPNWHYLPLVNPLDETLALSLLMLWLWQARLLRHGLLPGRAASTVLLAVLSAWWLNGALLRALAHYDDIAWTATSLWDSRLVQTTLALVWTVAALAIMVVAGRRASRTAWTVGAGVLGVVILKLFLVDSARGGGLARAIAFIGVALLVLLIGYVAPLPPRRPQQRTEAA